MILEINLFIIGNSHRNFWTEWKHTYKVFKGYYTYSQKTKNDFKLYCVYTVLVLVVKSYVITKTAPSWSIMVESKQHDALEYTHVEHEGGRSYSIYTDILVSTFKADPLSVLLSHNYRSDAPAC